MIARTYWRRGMILAVALAGIFGLVACLPVPLGDPAKSVADSRLFGVWEWRDAHVNRAIIRPWDQHTMIVDVLIGDLTEDSGTRPRERNVYKAWLTDIKGQTFMTMEPIETTGMVNGDSRPSYYLITRIKIEGATLTAMALDPDFKKLKDARDHQALERIVSDNLDDPKLFNNAQLVATRWTVEQMKGLDKLQQTFHDWK